MISYPRDEHTWYLLFVYLPFSRSSGRDISKSERKEREEREIESFVGFSYSDPYYLQHI